MRKTNAENQERLQRANLLLVVRHLWRNQTHAYSSILRSAPELAA